MFYPLFIIAAVIAASSASDSALTAPKPKPMKGCPLEIYMMDKFGDGWNGAKLAVSGGPKPKSFSPKPGPSALSSSVTVPLSPLDASVLSISDPKSGVPKEYWEIWWSFSLDGQVYVGGHETEITLMCMWKSPTDYVVQVIEVKNAVEDTCSRCQKPKPKPKPSKAISTADGNEVLTWAGSNGETLSLTMTQDEIEKASQQTSSYEQAVSNAQFEAQLEDMESDSNAGLTEATSESVTPGIVSSVINNIRRNLDLDTKDSPKPKPKPAPKKYPYVAMLLNTAGRGWFDGTGVSTYYAISDSTRYELVTSGTMCGSFSEQLCELQIPDGDYILRVGGNGDASKDDNTWEFCGVTGGAQTELSFSVKKGKCSASADLKSVSDLPKKTKKFDAMDDDTPDITDDESTENLIGKSTDSIGVSEQTTGESASLGTPAGVMVFASASIGAFIMGFIAVNAIVFLHVRRVANREKAAMVSTEITNEKLLAANGLTIIKESDLNSSRHKLVSSLDL